MQETQLLMLILLVIFTLIDLIHMRYGDWKFPHLFYGRYNSCIGILFAIQFFYSIFIFKSYTELTKIVCTLITSILYIIPYMFCYYILDKKKWELKHESESKAAEREKYLMHSWFKIKNIIKNDFINEEKSKFDSAMYTIVLEDENGKEKRIQTLDVAFYEKKMLAGEQVQIGKIRRKNM